MIADTCNFRSNRFLIEYNGAGMMIESKNNLATEKSKILFAEQSKFGWQRLKRILTIALLATTFSGELETVLAQGNNSIEISDHHTSAEQLSDQEIRQLAPVAKIPLYTDLGDGTFEMGHAGLAVETTTKDGLTTQRVLLCSVSHVVFPYTLRDKFFQPNPSEKIAQDYFSQTNKFSRTGLNSAADFNHASFLITDSLAIDMGNPDQSLLKNPYQDPPVCFPIDDDILQIYFKKDNFDQRNIPNINENPTFTKGEIVFAFDRSLKPQYYTVDEDSANGVMVKPTNLAAELALTRGDSGIPLYRKDPNGKTEMVGTYLGQNILPSSSGRNILFIVAKFDTKKD